MNNPSALSRRRFLQGALALGGAGLVAPSLHRLARAAEAASDRYFIFCYFDGGWDVTLSLDPRDPSVYTEERRRETLTDVIYPSSAPTEHPHAPGELIGPHLGALRDAWMHRVTIVRGMSMDSLGHHSARRRFITGKVPIGERANGSSIATHLAYQLGHDAPLPNLVARAESYNRGLPGWATGIPVGSPSELVRILSPSEATLLPEEEQQIDQVLGQLAECRTGCLSDLRARAFAARDEANEVVRRRIDQLFRFDDLPDSDPLITTFNPGEYRADANTLAALATQAITSKVSRVVSIKVAENLDTHAPLFAEHGSRQQSGFNAIAKMLQYLEDTPYDGTSSWIDHVTIVAYSEFARSALFGSQGGRDHHLMNACLLAGADVGSVNGAPSFVGASSDVGMMPQPVDLVTGRVTPESAGGVTLRPEHLLQGLMRSAGAANDERPDPADLRLGDRYLRAPFASLGPSTT